MGVFQADGVVTINGRGAGNVAVSFAVAGRRKLPFGRGVPPAVRTDKLRRFAQDGFLDTLTYAVAASAPGVSFQPATATIDALHRQVRLQGTATTFTARGVARLPAVPGQTGKPPGIPGVQISFIRAVEARLRVQPTER